MIKAFKNGLGNQKNVLISTANRVFLMVSYELILYSKKPNLVGKGNTISSYKHIFIFWIHFIQNVSHSKNGETKKASKRSGPLKDLCLTYRVATATPSGQGWVVTSSSYKVTVKGKFRNSSFSTHLG